LIAVQTDNPGAPLNREAWARLASFDKPVLTLFGERDPVSRGWDKRAQEYFKGAKGQDHQIIAGAGHFIQEDAAPELVDRITRFLSAR
jgi:haloalkane dehalogenase